MLDVTAHVNALTERVHDMLGSKSRLLVAIAGAPGSGKSTLAAEVARRLNQQKVASQVVPMDGFHLDNAILDARGLRGRKGAPETFDGLGFVNAIGRLQSGGEVIFPAFDRPRDIAVAGAVSIPADCAVVVVEGNYLLFDEAPWNALPRFWDLSARLDVPMPEIRSRIIQRWLSHNLSRAAATRRAESNDIPNAQRVMAHALPADIVLSMGRDAPAPELR